ncbi:hypothetical protein DB346_16575 [Verrucomicrobia bacterium LW23]|nr:hypothetical protein DB346_16575 [Verrucomicrobia bacterium LW23]
MSDKEMWEADEREREEMRARREGRYVESVGQLTALEEEGGSQFGAFLLYCFLSVLFFFLKLAFAACIVGGFLWAIAWQYKPTPEQWYTAFTILLFVFMLALRVFRIVGFRGGGGDDDGGGDCGGD